VGAEGGAVHGLASGRARGRRLTVPTLSLRRDAVPLSGQRVLVTGAAGFIGSRLCERLVSVGAEVHGVSRSQRNGTVRGWTADVTDAAAVRAVVRAVQPDVVFHLAGLVSGARDPGLVLPMLQSHTVGTINVLLASADGGCRRIVRVGSLEEPDEADAAAPVSPYAAAKSAAAIYARLFHRAYAAPVVALRLFMVYGPGQLDDTKLVPYVVGSFRRGRAPILSSGLRPVDWVFVDDVVDALIAAAAAEHVEGKTLDVGSGRLVTIRAIVEEIARQMGAAVAPQFGARPDRPNERVRAADLGRTQALIGWRPKTALTEGLAATIAWYAAREQAG
jgi:UDP-glucose 4-epimerase